MKIGFPRFRLSLLAFGLALAGFPHARVSAETHIAADLTLDAVRAALDAAEDGDTVVLPPGKIVWTKGLNTGRSAKMKAVTIQGAGIDQTIIGDDRSEAPDATFALLGVEGKPFRVTGITFDGADFPNSRTGRPLMDIRGTCKNFRIAPCKFKDADSMIGINGLGDGDTYGLIDHCVFEATVSHGGNVQPIKYSGPGAPNYRKPLNLGSGEAMYFEDNEVYIGPDAIQHGNVPWIAPNHASRVVIRRNKIVNSQLEIYRPGMNKQYGSQLAEIYDNEFSAVGVKQGTPQCFIVIGAGTALVFNNTVTGTTYNTRVIALRNERAWRDLPGFPKADGRNPTDGNRIPAGQLGAGYPCFGQVGWASNIDGQFVPTPCYAWNNTFNGAPLRMEVDRRADENEAATIREGRDFFNEKPPEGYYAPFVYPHPLQREP